MSHHQHWKYLLVGGGVASSAAAKAIRAHDAEGSLLLIGQEATRPYHRPPLSKGFLRGEVPRDELFTDFVGWFRQNHAELHTGLRAMHLDANRKCVSLDNGDEILFDKLLIATGGSPRQLTIPGANLPNVHYLRNLQDADRLHNAIEKAKREGRGFERDGQKLRGTACVIGGGLLGVELAASLTQVGLSVDLIVAAPHPWKKFAGEMTGKFIARYLEKHGVRVHLGAAPARLDGDGRVQRVVLTSAETLPCDFVVAAVGMVPHKELLRGTAIAAERAILVNEHCRTSVADVYAAGDCAALFDPLFGKHRQLDHWDSAVVTGMLAGRNMAGVQTRYDMVSHFFSEAMGLRIDVWGEGKLVNHRILRGSPGVDSPEFIEIGVAADGRVAQVLSVGHRGEDAVLRELVRRRFAVEGREEQLKDPAVKLQELL
jgi:3-phenylpropionate/trans-cinnamate dioxygenase ferredoxin reductase component